MAGHTKIGRKSFLGIGSTIMDDITVGEESVVGAGAVVIRNVPDRVVVPGFRQRRYIPKLRLVIPKRGFLKEDS